jgi:dolichyl-phosphate beta-glucosyltransferase
MKENIFLSIIVPAYNEEKKIESTLKEISGYINKRAYNCEIIVVDDGSDDNTFERAKGLASLFNNFKILKNPSNMGKGYSVRRAMLEAGGEYALFMDADNSTSIYEVDKFLPYLKEGYDVVIASRRLKDSIVPEPQPLLRAKMGQFFIFLSKVILGLNISDFNCGFKAYNVRSTRFVFELQKIYDWSFDVELLFLITKYGLKLKEVPVYWVHKSGSKVKPVKDAIKSFMSLLKIKLNNICHGYEHR